MAEVFRGQVKISDIQDAFDALVSKINELVDAYNEAENISGYSLDEGASYLAPSGYALSVGGLKKVLQAYDGAVIGCHAWRVGDDLLITNGIYIKDGSVTDLPQGMIIGAVANNPKYLYYSAINGYEALIQKSTDTSKIFITEINCNREMTICDTSSSSAIRSGLRVFCGNNGHEIETNDYNDSYRPCFVCGNNTTDIGRESFVYFKGVEVAHNWRTSSHNGKEVFTFPHFFLPKNISNPFTTVYGALKSFAYIEK